MDSGYRSKVYEQLEKRFFGAGLHRPMRIGRYEPGTELTYEVEAVAGKGRAQVCVIIEAFVGGGFAGQVYRVKVLDIKSEGGQRTGLEAGGIYAMKILIPPTMFSRVFRNALYWIGFQGPFQPQVNPAAAKAGALWQKFIRRGAKVWFGDEKVVADIHATFVDERLGSCGELSEWINGRTWRLEVDDRMDLLKRWSKGGQVDAESLGSPEYRAKREFMSKFVELAHEVGWHEFARQYEWSTWKSQPNCLKRRVDGESPFIGLVAVDFRAGLALLPFLPMSPGDFRLIVKGMLRGSLVQFDRGDIGKLEDFVEANRSEFADMYPMLDELKAAERVYRDSIPDITHNHVRLVCRSGLWSTMLNSAVTGWRVRNLVDERCENKLRSSKALTVLFFLIGIVPFLGRFFRRMWGRKDWRKHYWRMVASWEYLRRAVRGTIAENAIKWRNSGRIDDAGAMKITGQSWRFWYHVPLVGLPAGIHRFFTDWGYAKERLAYVFVRPVRLYFNGEEREQWLREMIGTGKENHLLSGEDAGTILSQLKEPFIQKYLKSLAVHVCTLPVTQIVSVLTALIYVAMHPDMPRAHAWGIGLGIIALFQVIPISPGSLVRGLYVVYLVIRERNFRDYNIAVFLGFFKYIGYLAFPIQMGYRYPALARFMAAHWATEAVHIVPVFGERGALLEHKVFGLFYNWPLTMRRRMRRREQLRSTIQPRYWHIALCVIGGLGIFGLADLVYVRNFGESPGLREIWWLAMVVPMVCGAAVTLGAAGAALPRRIIGALMCGGAVGVLYTLVSALVANGETSGMTSIAIECVWRVFVFGILSPLGLIVTELLLPEPILEDEGSWRG